MPAYNIFSVWLIFSLVAAFVRGEGEPCRYGSKGPGICVPITSCQPVVDLLRTNLTPETKEFIRNLACDATVRPILICCETNNTLKTSPIIQEVNDSNESNESVEFLSPPACGKSTINLPKVVGGVPAKLGDFPWMAVLGYRKTSNPNEPKWLCSGTLITDKHVLTASHCILDNLFLVRVGELDLYSDDDGANPVDIPIQTKHVHEKYAEDARLYDIAVLVLSRSTANIPGVWPVCLPWISELKTKNFVNFNLYIAGWGKTNYTGLASPILQTATVPVIPQSQCQNQYRQISTTINDNVLCAGVGPKDACSGDSGGPLMYGSIKSRQREITFYQLGVISYGIKCATPQYSGVYTRVTTFLDWIKQKIA